MNPEYPYHINAVRAVGTLDIQRAGRRELSTVTQSWNAVRGIEQRAVLQVRSPFRTPFKLPLRFDGLVEGRELLETGMPGTVLRVEGILEWSQREDPRYATAPLNDSKTCRGF